MRKGESNGGGFWNCRSDSVRLKAFRRKASIGSQPQNRKKTGSFYIVKKSRIHPKLKIK